MYLAVYVSVCARFGLITVIFTAFDLITAVQLVTCVQPRLLFVLQCTLCIIVI